jgi:serine/threonine-protein kinase
MAIVYLCTDTESGKRVAVKILRPEYAHAVAAERFLREVDFVSKLDHPFIPKIIDTGLTAEQPYYVMTFVDGEPLRKLIERKGKLPIEEAVSISRAIIEPLGYAHSRGIVHRDIKPDNIIIGTDGVYVLDFGIARAILDAGGERLTKTGLTVGTPAYISPEQASADRNLDHRSDIFSLGCVIYEMLAGAQPFVGATPQVLIASRFMSPPIPLKEKRDDVPDALAAVISRAMRLPPGDRWENVSEFGEALQEAITQRSASSAASSTSDDDVAQSDLIGRLRKTFAGQYEVDSEMKGGGMSRLFLARDPDLDRKVVIKILPPDLTSPMMLARFKRESAVTAKLQHPHILPVIAAGVRDGLAFYIMPFFEGESLRARLQRDGKLPVGDAIRILAEMSDAVSCAHEKGVIHRDIKPENILILGGHAVLADFGIASALSGNGKDSSGERITGTGMSLGTVGYMAPEQALGEKDVDGRADIYSLGVVGYEMLAGKPPFTGETDQAILVGHLTREPEPIEKFRAETPGNVSAAIRKALEKTPSSRWQTASEFHDAIESSRTTSPILVAAPDKTGALPAASPRSEPSAGSSSNTRSRLWRIAVPIAAVAVIAIGAAYMKSHKTVPAGPVLDAKSVAVLYFRDLSPTHELGHLADAFTEELIANLQDVNGIEVVSKNGVQQIRKEKVSPDSAARLLGAGTLVEGSVAPVGDRLRVVVAMNDGSSGDELERASFEYPSSDATGIRERLVKDVSDFLRKRLGDQIKLSEWKAGTGNSQAWLLAQRGERLIKDAENLSTSGDTAGATRALADADSAFALSAARDQSWIQPVVMRGTVAFRRSRISSEAPEMARWADRGLTFAQQALSSDSRNAEALELRGTLRYWKWLNDLAADPKQAAELLRTSEEDLRLAVKIAPHRGSAWSVLSSLFANKADPIEAAMAARRAYEEDAYLSAAPDIVWRLYSSAYDNQQAVPAEHWCTEGRRRFPANPRFVQCRLWLLTMPGMRSSADSAWRLVQDLRKLTPDNEWPFSGREAQMLVAAGLTRAGLQDSARRVLVRSRGDATIDPSRDLLIDEAVVRVILGDKDDALQLLKQYLVANPEHRAGMAESQSWWWRDLKSDPRYVQMVGDAAK